MPEPPPKQAHVVVAFGEQIIVEQVVSQLVPVQVPSLEPVDVPDMQPLVSRHQPHPVCAAHVAQLEFGAHGSLHTHVP